MAVLAVDHNLLFFKIFLPELLFDALLKPQYDRTGCVDDFDIILVGDLVSLRWLSVCAKQHFGIAQLSELITVDRN